MAEPSSPVGLITGGGALPLETARIISARGRGVFLVGLEGEAGPEIEAFPHAWVNWGQIGKLTGSLKRAGCRDIALVGRVRRPDLKRIRLDAGFFRAVPTLMSILAGGDDSILRRVVRFFEVHGFEVRGLAELAPELLARSGQLGRHAAHADFVRDLDVGLEVLRNLSPFDIGQAVVVRSGEIVAIEAAEGTDGMLRLLAEQQRSSGTPAASVLIKAPKAGQEMRIDVPVIGPETVARAAAAGLSGIAVTAGRVLITARAEMLEAADAAGLFVAGFDARAPASPQQGGPPSQAGFVSTGRRRPARQESADIQKGRSVLAALDASRGVAGTGVIVARDYVLAVAAREGPVELCRRARSLRQWGDGSTKRRRGVLVVRTIDGDAEEVARVAIDAGLAAIAVADEQTAARLTRTCNGAGLAVVAYHAMPES